MALFINSNLASLSAQARLAEATTSLAANYGRLSSGLRISTAGDDPSGLAISERMRARSDSLSQAARNAQDGISLIQTADAAMNEVVNMVVRMRELAVQAANGTLTPADRMNLDAEVQALLGEVTRVTEQTSFNGIPLLGNSTTIWIQVGADGTPTDQIPIVLSDMTPDNFLGANLAAFNVLDEASANYVMAVVDVGMLFIDSFRGWLGASENRLQSAVRSIDIANQNLMGAESRIRDVDIAAESAALTRNSIIQQAAVSVLAQANLQPSIALSLIGGGSLGR